MKRRGQGEMTQEFIPQMSATAKAGTAEVRTQFGSATEVAGSQTLVPLSAVSCNGTLVES